MKYSLDSGETKRSQKSTEKLLIGARRNSNIFIRSGHKRSRLRIKQIYGEVSIPA